MEWSGMECSVVLCCAAGCNVMCIAYCGVM